MTSIPSMYLKSGGLEMLVQRQKFSSLGRAPNHEEPKGHITSGYVLATSAEALQKVTKRHERRKIMSRTAV
jgi:hypothetical protein